MRLFLTGATGFVGRNLLLTALRAGRYDEIVVAVRDPDKLRRQLAGEKVSTSGVAIVPWDAPVSDGIDHAVLCAGMLFARNRDEYFRVNVEGTLGHLPKSARTLVLSSQAAGGPTPEGRDVRLPSDADRPVTWYGESKLEMERRVRQVRPDAMIWRPPMILGPRDQATLPLFRMARGMVRIKPGLAPKTYSWIAVDDLVASMMIALSQDEAADGAPLPVCAPDSITDLDLIESAAAICEGRGITARLPHTLVRVFSVVVDGVPALRAAVPSLTRDRAKDIFPDRWVIDGVEFQRRFGPKRFRSLDETLRETCDWYRQAGLLP